MYGLYKDNVLTYLIRISDMSTFEYILRRDVSPLASNENDLNAIHIAIKLEKMSFLSYLFEGDFYSYQENSLDEVIIEAKYKRLVTILTETNR